MIPTAICPGDTVIWLKRVSGESMFPVQAKVLAVTAKRVKIKADDPEEGGRLVFLVKAVESGLDRNLKAAIKENAGVSCKVEVRVGSADEMAEVNDKIPDKAPFVKEAFHYGDQQGMNSGFLSDVADTVEAYGQIQDEEPALKLEDEQHSSKDDPSRVSMRNQFSDFMNRLLHPDPSQRLSPKQAMEHPGAAG